MAPLSPQRLAGLAGGRIGIWGLGREGRAALDHLRRWVPGARFEVLLDDAGEEAAARRLLAGWDDVRVLAGAARPASLGGYDLIVKSPGVSLYRPEIVAARSAGLTVTSATQLWFDLPPRGRVAFVTGTKGKSTTVSMLAAMLVRAGIPAAAVGNIGRPPLAADDLEPRPEVWVLELSSYQAADLDATADLGVLLNLYPEHLTWHGGEERYFADKLRPFGGLPPGAAVINRADRRIRERLDLFHDPVFFNDPAGLHSCDGALWDGGRRLASLGELPLSGEHDLVNACAALAAARALGAATDPCLEALGEHRPLPHRLQRLGERDGLLWVDDSLSTIPEATVAAVAAFAGRPVTVLVGGHDRGVEYGGLAARLVAAPVQAVICLPESGARVAAALRAELQRVDSPARPALFEAAGLEEAVEIARRETPKGGVVLLSPAAASFGRFRDYRERGAAFAAAAGL
ncbi:MAG: UDP-N-acetylmuramoyl-L-alanine--D-glutamate ligase [Thermoanaerobaculia bacterium]|nr:UDP-N-acetylmuramoyl-L-alanine--D-glutamate ligase [Thermoanaerobaculia bacterium]